MHCAGTLSAFFDVDYGKLININIALFSLKKTQKEYRGKKKKEEGSD